MKFYVRVGTDESGWWRIIGAEYPMPRGIIRQLVCTDTTGVPEVRARVPKDVDTQGPFSHPRCKRVLQISTQGQAMGQNI